MGKMSIRKIVACLNNSEENGGFWLPNIQRPFVWSEEQICRLFDSIMRKYPISTLLVWKTKSKIRRREFIKYFKEEHRHHLSNFRAPLDDKKKCLVLDGQQRLQSLLIGLHGSYNGKELHLDILSGEISAPDDAKYKFKFLDSKSASFPNILFKEIVFSHDKPRQISDKIVEKSTDSLTDEECDKVKDHVDLILQTFTYEDGIFYQELDSIDNPVLYQEDDVVEIFIRANSGGTRLGKSDLMFSLLSSTWDEADDNMEILLDELNQHGFAFTRDFVLKTCLTLLNQGARYEITKFRKEDIRKQIESNWDRIGNAVKDVTDFVYSKTFIQCDKALPSYLVLIPIIYFRYHFPDAWPNKKGVDTYLLRSLFAGAFSGQPDQLIDNIVENIKELGDFSLEEVFGVIRSAQRSLELTEERFWSIGYGTGNIHLLFNLWYYDFKYVPAYKGNYPQIDHIFPQSRLREVKTPNPKTGRSDIMKYREWDRNQLANCMLLSAEENGGGGKGDSLPSEWFKNKSTEYLEKHLIPSDPKLWELNQFENFIEERKKLIREKFNNLLAN